MSRRHYKGCYARVNIHFSGKVSSCLVGRGIGASLSVNRYSTYEFNEMYH